MKGSTRLLHRTAGARSVWALAFAATLAACGDSRGVEAPSADGETPVRGGTLEIIGDSDLDHLSTSSGYYTVTQIVFRAFTRQLVSYPPEPTFDAQKELVPDLAREVPAKENGGISADGLTYTYHIRPGVRWDTQPARAVTAGDVVRGFEMMCNPVSPVGAPGYFRTTIEGMAEWCDAFAEVPGTVEDIRRFVTSRDISGVSAPDDSTFVVRLARPSADFVHLTGMSFTSPMPVEYLDHLPDGPEFRAHTISNGPYRITSYVAAREISFGRNPAWDPAADPLRKAWVDSIHVVMGISGQSVQQQLEAGTADLSWDQPPPTADMSRLIEARDPNLIVGPEGDDFIGMYYLPINTLSPNANGAFKKLAVRQALNFAVDRSAIVQISGGPTVGRSLHQAVVSTGAGYREGFAPHATPGERGDSAKARELLAQAGYASGLPVKLLYSTGGLAPLYAQTVQASLTRAGFQVELVQATGSDLYARYLSGPENARRGVWDVAIASWFPDWYGNNGRTVIQAIFDGRTYGPNSTNWGGYDNPEVGALIDQALAAPTQQESFRAWEAAATEVIEDAAIVPLMEFKVATYKSARVRNCVFNLTSTNCDLTALWLQGGGE
jgi:ABC-type transport system substrate-binding protein